jgi:hypothetical protein
MNEKIIFHAESTVHFSAGKQLTARIAVLTALIAHVSEHRRRGLQKRRGIVLAKSFLAKKYGIQPAKPVVSAIRKCPFLIVGRRLTDCNAKCSANFMALLNNILRLSNNILSMNFFWIAHKQ